MLEEGHDANNCRMKLCVIVNGGTEKFRRCMSQCNARRVTRVLLKFASKDGEAVFESVGGGWSFFSS